MGQGDLKCNRLVILSGRLRRFRYLAIAALVQNRNDRAGKGTSFRFLRTICTNTSSRDFLVLPKEAAEVRYGDYDADERGDQEDTGVEVGFSD